TLWQKTYQNALSLSPSAVKRRVEAECGHEGLCQKEVSQCHETREENSHLSLLCCIFD
ncbi:hypothetical protein KIL84_015213, partial [Mauremys mutica]